MKWFFIDENITDGDRRVGPLSTEDIQDFAKQGKINDETLVWKSGEDDWKPWKTFREDLEKHVTLTDESREELLKNTIEALEKTMNTEAFRTRRFAGFFTRAISFIVDNLILAIAGGILLYAIGIVGFVNLEEIQDAANIYMQDPTSIESLNKFMDAPGMSLFLSVWSVLQTAYFVIFHAVFSATPGKMLLHIHVETKDGYKLSWGGSIARYLCSVLTQFTMVFYGIGYLIVCIDPKRRALHDWIAKTFVVHDSRKKGF